MKAFAVSPGSKVEVRELDDIVKDIYEIIGGTFEVDSYRTLLCVSFC